MTIQQEDDEDLVNWVSSRCVTSIWIEVNAVSMKCDIEEHRIMSSSNEIPSATS